MCEAKPGTRCAADTHDAACQTRQAYASAYVDGPAVDPLASAAATFTPAEVRVVQEGDVRVEYFDKGTALAPDKPVRTWTELTADLPNRPVRVEREVGQYGTMYRVQAANHPKFAKYHGETATFRLARAAGATGPLTYFGNGEVRADIPRGSRETSELPSDFRNDSQVAFTGSDMIATIPGKGGQVSVDDGRLRQRIGDLVPVLHAGYAWYGAEMCLNEDGTTSLFSADESEERFDDSRIALRAHASRVLD